MWRRVGYYVGVNVTEVFSASIVKFFLERW